MSTAAVPEPDRTGETRARPSYPRDRGQPCPELFEAWLGDAGRDLLADDGLRFITKKFPAFVALGLLIPFLLGLALTQSLAGGLTALLWGGFVRIFLLHHVTWSINSVCHFFGRRRFDTDDHSTNVFWLALPSFGESWHHNHHAFPTSAKHGLRWWEVDTSALLIGLLERLGLAWNVVKVAPERQQAKLAAAQPSRVAA